MEIRDLSGGTPEEIIRFMRSFVRMTKAHIGIHDVSYSTSVGCGENDNICEYCKTKCGRFLEKCKDDDKKYLDIAMESGKIAEFSCHLGVVSVIIPIFEGDRISGAVDFGMIRLTDGERRDGGEEFEKTFFRLCSEYPESFGENDRAEMERAWRSTSGMTRDELDDWTEIVGIAARGLYVSHLFTGEHMTSELIFRLYLNRLDATHLPLSGFSVSGAANSLNISYPNFARLSRRVLGMPLKQYILKRKTADAAEMISSGQIRTVRAAASAVGIDDPRYFSRLFIRHIGCSCSEYIRRHGKSRE